MPGVGMGAGLTLSGHDFHGDEKSLLKLDCCDDHTTLSLQKIIQLTVGEWYDMYNIFQ